MTLLPLFLYGTLRDADILASVLGRRVPAKDLVPATAPDCIALYYPDRLYPALVHRVGCTAPGLLLARASLDDLAALDAFEGDEYRRGPVPVTIETGLVTAYAYWPAIAVPASAAEWTLEGWTREHKPAVLARETALAVAARLGTARR